MLDRPRFMNVEETLKVTWANGEKAGQTTISTRQRSVPIDYSLRDDLELNGFPLDGFEPDPGIGPKFRFVPLS